MVLRIQYVPNGAQRNGDSRHPNDSSHSSSTALEHMLQVIPQCPILTTFITLGCCCDDDAVVDNSILPHIVEKKLMVMNNEWDVMKLGRMNWTRPRSSTDNCHHLKHS
jgi:hypothetical protein